jgi:RNA polymerase sigma-70 factor, ECF subfamily
MAESSNNNRAGKGLVGLQNNQNNLESVFTKAYDEYSDPLYRFIYYKISDKEAAKDILQQLFMKVWDYMQAGNQIKEMKPVLYKVASNLVMDFYRKKKTISMDDMIEDGFDVVDTRSDSSLKSETNLLIKSIGRLDERYKDVLMMRYVEELSISEIAEVMGESKNNVSVRINRAIKLLKKNLDNKNDGENN